MIAQADDRTAELAVASFNTRLDQAIDKSGSLVCVGLDPHPERLEEPALDFCRRVIDATWESAAAFKPNIAFFEAAGAQGLADLKVVMQHAPPDRMMVLDAKRGDIGSTAKAYVKAIFAGLGADAVTISPYLGGDSIAPFLADASRGAFLLCHTSNPGAGDLQHLDVGGHPLYIEVARRAASDWNVNENLGLVVGATYPEALEEVRATAPRLPFLVPGIGAQGGDLEASVRAGTDANGRGMLINSSRGIIFAADPSEAAKRLRDAIDEARGRAG